MCTGDPEGFMYSRWFWLWLWLILQKYSCFLNVMKVRIHMKFGMYLYFFRFPFRNQASCLQGLTCLTLCSSQSNGQRTRGRFWFNSFKFNVFRESKSMENMAFITTFATLFIGILRLLEWLCVIHHPPRIFAGTEYFLLPCRWLFYIHSYTFCL